MIKNSTFEEFNPKKLIIYMVLNPVTIYFIEYYKYVNNCFFHKSNV